MSLRSKIDKILGVERCREDWLDRAAGLLFREKWNGFPIPEFRVSVGWPLGTRVAKRKGKGGCIGQCWSAGLASDRIAQIFISPILTDSVQIVATLAHELIHAILPGNGHDRHFAAVAYAIGLEGPPTATVASPDFAEWVRVSVVGVLGDYPSGGLTAKETEKRKKDGTRQLKLECPKCGFLCRTSQKWIDYALPVCGACEVSLERAE